ncbi:MAG: T9SS type B sorting domain-containing protein [Bacteroidia bacterium]
MSARVSAPEETEGGTLCPTTIPLIAKDSLVYSTSGSTSIPSGSSLNCLTRSLYLFTNTSGGFIDSIKSIYSPGLEVRFDTYQTSLATYGTMTIYEGSSVYACIGPSGCVFPIGGNTPPVSGSKWSLFISELDPTLSHTFVFSKTGTIATTTVTVKTPWLTTALNTFTWSPSTANAYSVTIPANTPIGNCNFAITPTVSASAFTDLKGGFCKISPRQMPLGTYTVTYTLNDTVCTSKTANYIFTVGLPNVSWVTPHPCLPGPTINLTGQLSASAVTGGTWSGTGVSGTTFSPASAGLGTFNITYAVGTGTCSNTSTNPLTVNTTPTVNVTSGSYCPGGTSSLSANGANTYVWSPSTALSGTTGSNVNANPTSTTIYTVIGTSNFCNAYATSTVTVFSQPVAAFNANPQTTFITNPMINFTDASTGATISNWQWDFGDGNTSASQNPSNTYSAIGIYNVQLLVISNKGCKDSITHSVEIKADKITVYNSFSPNGDGLNDVFEIDNIDQFGPNHVSIYNRWGQLLWDKTGYDNKNVVWDGKDSKGVVLSPGTYFYIVEVEGKKTEKHWLELTK